MTPLAQDRAATVDTGALYEQIRRDFCTTLLRLSVDDRALRVPASPEWRVRDVLGHVAGLAADLNAQRFPNPHDDAAAWTAAQVDARANMTIGEIVAEWEPQGAAFAEVLRAFGYEFGSHFVADLHAHVQDVHQALGLPRYDDELTVRVALDHYLGYLDEALLATGWGTVTIVADDESRTLGAPAHHAVVLRGPAFEVLRACAARRSAAQLRAMEWNGDRDEFIEGITAVLASTGSYRLPDIDLIE